MTNEQALAIVIGLIMPFIISFLKRASWETAVKFWFAIAVCLAAGVAQSIVSNQMFFKWDKALVDAAIIFVASQAFYKTWFEGTDIDKTLTGD